MLKVIGAHPVVGTKPHATHVVSFDRALYFDDIGTQFAENSSAGRSCNKMSEIEYSVALQHRRLLFHSVLPARSRRLVATSSPSGKRDRTAAANSGGLIFVSLPMRTETLRGNLSATLGHSSSPSEPRTS